MTLGDARKLYTHPDPVAPSSALLLTSVEFLTTRNSIAGVYICRISDDSRSQEKELNITVLGEDGILRLTNSGWQFSSQGLAPCPIVCNTLF